MAVTNIPDDHHVVRHCKNRVLIRVNGAVTGVYPEAFHLRPKTDKREQEKYLSAVYYENFTGSPPEMMKACCAALPLKEKSRDGLARVNVRKAKDAGKKQNKSLRVTHEPKKGNQAYAAIRGIPENIQDELFNLLATTAVVETIEVSALPA